MALIDFVWVLDDSSFLHEAVDQVQCTCDHDNGYHCREYQLSEFVTICIPNKKP